MSKKDIKNNVSVLFLTKDRGASVRKCLFSLEYLLEMRFVNEWIILDNASKDNTPKWLENRYSNNKKVKLIFSKENLGVAGGRSKLLEIAQGDTILILDSDVLDKNKTFLPRLIKIIDASDIGITGVHGCNINPDWSWVHERPAGYVDVITGYCQLFKRNVLDKCKLDQFYNPYWIEDSDFCMQIRCNLGLKAYSIGSSYLVHKWGKTCSGTDQNRLIKWEYFKNKWKDKYEAIKNPNKINTSYIPDWNI